MMKLSYAEIQENLYKSNTGHLPPLNLVVLRNIVLEPIKPYLEYLAYELGFRARVTFGEYDNIFQDVIGNEKNLINDGVDCVLIFMKLEVLSEQISRNFAGLKNEKIVSEMTRIKDYIDRVLSGLCDRTNSLILWHGFELPAFPALGIQDSQNSNGQLSLINRLNDYLKTKFKDRKNTYFVDLNLCLARLGAHRYYDLRYWHIGRAPYSREALREIASEDFKYIRPLKGKNKKCLVLDCDNVLWGGIIGEDGMADIKLAKTYPGSVYYEFQQEILNLYHRGIILALCSKNNEQDVWEVFDNHPDMVLKKKYIAAAQINWKDKAANLKQIAMDLNIGLDSLVFVDDSEFEINLIREVLPEIEVIHLPKNKAVDYRNILASCGLFDTMALSEEDKKRGEMYKAEAIRKKVRADTKDIKSYLKSLEMELEIRYADEFSIPRVSQLTQKTNQFNLTTKRYSESDIKNFIESDASDVIYARLKDKFGDSGIIGICILKYEDYKAIFDSFLLSCRILGRGVEDAFLIQALKLARKKDYKLAIGEYFATPKNAQVERFFIKHGFQEQKDMASRADGYFQYQHDKPLKPEPEFFKKIDSEFDENK